jgi:hypothetical protein
MMELTLNYLRKQSMTSPLSHYHMADLSLYDSEIFFRNKLGCIFSLLQNAATI